MTSAIDFYSSGKKICYFSTRFPLNSSRDANGNHHQLCAGTHSPGFSGPYCLTQSEQPGASEQRDNEGEFFPLADISSLMLDLAPETGRQHAQDELTGAHGL
jgi:hypothetical protein